MKLFQDKNEARPFIKWVGGKTQLLDEVQKSLPRDFASRQHVTDGRKIVLTKPGGKMSFGRLSKEDFLVFIYNPKTQELWQISHNQILEDLRAKADEDKKQAKLLIDVFESVLNGADPEDLQEEISAFSFTTGELPEALLKAYKWIWGQEDVNYPNGQGRMMSWEGITELRDSL